MSKFRGKIILFLISTVGVKVLYLLSKSYRVKITGRDIEDRIRREHPAVLYAFWHQRFLYLPYLFKNSKGYVLISYSRDGEMAAKIAEAFGILSIRGSSSRGRISSTREIVEAIEKGGIFGIAPDGPKGPACKVKPGIIKIAKQTGAPILPMTVGAGRKWCFNSWDKFIVPKPFSKICIKYGEPVFIDRDSSDEVLESKRSELEERLITITEEADGM